MKIRFPLASAPRVQEWVSLLRQTADAWKEHNVPRLSAALSYYAIFSLTPLVVLLLMVSGLWLGAEAAREQLDVQMQAVVGPTTAGAVGDLVGERKPPTGSGVAALGSVAFLLFGATRLFAELKESLNSMWSVPRSSGRAVRRWSRKRLGAIVMMAVVFLLLVAYSLFSLAVAAGAAALGRWVAVHPALWVLVGGGGGLALQTVLFALMFYLLPDVRCPLRDVWLGAAATSVLFELGKWLLGWYLSQENTLTPHGATGSVMIVLLWVYYSSMIVLTGAEFTQVYSRRPRPPTSTDVGQ